MQPFRCRERGLRASRVAARRVGHPEHVVGIGHPGSMVTARSRAAMPSRVRPSLTSAVPRPAHATPAFGSRLVACSNFAIAALSSCTNAWHTPSPYADSNVGCSDSARSYSGMASSHASRMRFNLARASSASSRSGSASKPPRTRLRIGGAVLRFESVAHQLSCTGGVRLRPRDVRMPRAAVRSPGPGTRARRHCGGRRANPDRAARTRLMSSSRSRCTRASSTRPAALRGCAFTNAEPRS